MALQVEVTRVVVSGSTLDGFALAMHGTPKGHAVYEFPDVDDAFAFAMTLANINADFSVKHAVETCCWAGEGCCKPEGAHA